MKYVSTLSACLLAGLLMFSSCNSGKDKANDVTDTTSSLPDTAAMMKNDPQILSELPPVSQIPAMIQSTGADFMPTLINPYRKADNYTTTSEKAAVNLGIFGADIGYLSVYNKTQDIINTVKAAQKLADQVGVTQVFDPAVQKRFQDNLAKKDSLVSIVNSSMKAADDFLKKSDRNNIAALVATGTFVEGLYLSTGMVENYPAELKNSGVLTQLIQTIVDQESSLNDLIKIVKGAKKEKDAALEEYLKGLEELSAVYKSSNLKEQIKNNKGDLMLKDKDLIDITNKVKAIRSKIVN
jgi:hypothetical protein